MRTQHNDKQSADPVVNRGTADEVTGSDPVISSDMTVELQSLSTQMGYMLVVSLSDQSVAILAQAISCSNVPYDFSASRAFLVLSCPSVYNPVL